MGWRWRTRGRKEKRTRQARPPGLCVPPHPRVTHRPHHIYYLGPRSLLMARYNAYCSRLTHSDPHKQHQRPSELPPYMGHREIWDDGWWWHWLQPIIKSNMELKTNLSTLSFWHAAPLKVVMVEHSALSVFKYLQWTRPGSYLEMTGCRSLCSSETPLWFLALYRKGVVSSQSLKECSFCHLSSTFDSSEGSCLTEVSGRQIPACALRHRDGHSADRGLELAFRSPFGPSDWKFHSVLPWHSGKAFSSLVWKVVMCVLGFTCSVWHLAGTGQHLRCTVCQVKHVHYERLCFVRQM